MMVINTRKGNVRYPSKFQYTSYSKKKNSIPSNNGGRSYNKAFANLPFVKVFYLKHVSSKDRQNNYDRQTGTFLFFLFFLRFLFLSMLAIPLLSFPKEGMICMFCVSACCFWFFFLLRGFFLGGKSTLLDPFLTIAGDNKESSPFRLDDGAVNFLTTSSSVSFRFLLVETALPSVETFCSIFKSFLAKSATKNPLV